MTEPDGSELFAKPLQLRFSLRDAFWFMLVAALAIGWWVDRSAVAWRHERLRAITSQAVARLDVVDPGWQSHVGSPASQPEVRSWVAWEASGYGIGLTIFLVLVAILVLIWRGNLHPSILEERPRL
jgi:hypothetical protein